MEQAELFCEEWAEQAPPAPAVPAALEPENPEFAPIVLQGRDEGAADVKAELVAVL